MANSRVKNSVRNIVYRLLSQVINVLVKFISRSIFIYVLGVEYLGINGLFSELLQILSLAELGFGTAMVFSMYKPLAENDEVKLAQLVQLYKKVYIVIAASISLIGVALLPFLHYFVNFDSEIPYLRIYYLLYLANTVASYLVVYKTCILNADQKNYLVSKYNTIFTVLSSIFCAVFLFITKNFMIYLIVQVIFTYANNFYQSYVAQKLYPYINVKVPPLAKKEKKGIFNNVKSVFIYKLSTTLVSSTDNTLISMIVGTVTVGYYSNYTMIISNITMFINIIFSSITASIGNMIVEENDNKNYAVYKTMQFVSFVLSTLSVVCIYTLINDFITIWLGKGYILDNLTLVAIIINMYFSVALMPIWSYREATGMYRQTKYVMVVTAIVNLILSIVLGKCIGLAGILFATSIARISTYFWYEPKLLFSQFFGRKVTNYYKGILYNIFITVVVVIMVEFLCQGIHPVSWLIILIKSAVVGILTLGFILLFYFRNSELNNLIKLVKSLVKR